MRIQIAQEDLNKVFTAAKVKESWKSLADKIGVSPRNLFDWRRGRITIPEQKFKVLLKISSFKKNFPIKRIPDFWHIIEAAKKGARERMRIYGNPGTIEGRRLGGLRSLQHHRIHKTRFRSLKKIRIPERNELLAEFLGIIIGDGHLSDYQCSVATNSITDIDHAYFIEEFVENIFGLKSKVILRKLENAVIVVISSRSLVLFLEECGMPIGNKIMLNVCVPDWIKKNYEFRKAFIRGLFDTDGSIFLDYHKVNGKDYFHLGWAITSYSPNLRKDIFEILAEMGFRPTCRDTQKSVYIRRGKEVVRYFNEVGSHNAKHLKRFAEFIGRVPKWS